MILYADDTNIFLADTSLDRLESVANIELEKVSNWFRANKLQLNVRKTKYMLYNVKNKMASANVKLKLDNDYILQVDHVNFLGLIIDQNYLGLTIYNTFPVE